MLNEDEQNADSSQKYWLWQDCKLVLRRTNPKNPTQQSYENLEAEYELECQQIPQPFMPILSFKTDFKHNGQAYFWKKHTPLPTLTVKLQESYFQLLNEDEDYLMIYCELTVVYPNRKQTHFYLEQVKTLGNKIQEFNSSGFVEFSGILLQDCFLQKGNNKFSLLVRICASSNEQSKIILKTLISTAFFVFNSRIKRKNPKSKLFMKLISPKRFLKPLSILDSLQLNFNKQNLLNFMRHCNLNVRHLSLTHPLHTVYHYSDILKLCYNTDQVTDLNDFLQTITPGLNQCNKMTNWKKYSFTYELKKTKRINKNQQNSEKKFRKKLSLIIRTQKKQAQNSQNKILLVTFRQNIIKDINQAIELEKTENRTSPFEIELLKEINVFTKIIDQWKNFSIEIDLLREEPESDIWKDIKKDEIYEAYSKHYRMTKNRLCLLQKHTPNLSNHIYHSRQKSS